MKTFLISAALLLGSAAMAQESPPTEPAQSPEAAQPASPDMMPPPSADAMPAQDPMAAPPSPNESAMPAAGAKQFGTPPTVDQKYPPPPAKAEYPWCSKSVTDGCKQRRSPK